MASTYRPRVSRTCLFLLLSCHTLSVAAQSPEPEDDLSRQERVRELRARVWEAWAAPLEGELSIDGRLDEPAWQRAKPVTEFYQRDRADGTPESERTEVRILYDDDNLYLGFICFDRQMDKVISRAIFRDESGAYDDQLVIMIDPYNDHRGAYVFSTNANGFKIDGLQTGEAVNTLDANWDAVWDAAGSRDADRWQAELAIPFKSLRYKAPAEGEEIVFGIGFKRNLRRRNEEDIWPFVSNDSSWYRPASLGHLRGISKANPGRNLEFRPYALGERSQNLDADLEDQRGELGLDAKWGITPGLTADFSINTDFAQEEVDLQQINFTRFSLFFPEKRQFFLEGERMFQFGIKREAELVFTRRIGLSPLGEVIPIKAGARLSGRAGRYAVGAMNIQTQESGVFPSENFTVLRLQRDLFNRSTVGALFTNRQGGGRFNRVYGADVNLLLRDAWTFEGFFARMDEDTEPEGSDSTYLRAAFDKDLWGTGYRFLDIEEDFNPGVGFVRRPDSEEHFGEVRFSPRPGADWIRQFHLTASVSYIRNQQKTLETRDRAVQLVTAFDSGDRLTLKYTNRFEAITEPFALRSGLLIAPGSYRFNVYDAEFSSFRGRPTQFSVFLSRGGFWDGERTIGRFQGRYRPSKHLELSGSWETNWLEFPQGEFLTHLVSTRILIAFRPDLMLLPLLQYNHDTGLFSANVRFNWIPKPGTDFFIVYNELDEWNRGLGAKNRSLVVKLVYLFSL